MNAQPARSRLTLTAMCARVGIIAAILLVDSKADAEPVACGGHDYDSTEQASIAALLKTNYGDAYKSFDLDHPSVINIGGRNVSRVVFGRTSWVAFARGDDKQPQATDVPTRIVVAFNICSGRAVALQVVR